MGRRTAQGLRACIDRLKSNGARGREVQPPGERFVFAGVNTRVAGRQIHHQARLVIEMNRHQISRLHSLQFQLARQDAHIFIAAPREIHNQYVMRL